MCFSLSWLMELLVWIVIIAAIVAIVNVLLPRVLGLLSGIFGEAAGMLVQILRIVLWAVVTIFVIYVAFDLISCLMNMSGGSLRLPRAR